MAVVLGGISHDFLRENFEIWHFETPHLHKSKHLFMVILYKSELTCVSF